MLRFWNKWIEAIEKLSPPQMIVLSFSAIVCAGTLLLSSPMAVNGERLGTVDALFTAVSAMCVTGLSVIDIGTRLSIFGQVVVLLLIQFGGLGIMTFSTFFIYLLGRKVSFRDREIIDTTLSNAPVKNIGILLIRIFAVVVSLEALGALILTLFWMKEYSLIRAFYYGVFHSISAFCNAGFSLFSNNLEGYRSSLWLNGTIMALVVAGGLGFVVLLDLRNLFKRSKGKTSRLSAHSKIVLTMAAWLIGMGALLLFWIEKGQGFKGMQSTETILVSLFQSVTARTAGFNTVRIGSLTNASCLILMAFMFIGAAPGSCGGGVKVTTIGILVAMVISRLRGHEDTQLFQGTVSRETVTKALMIIIGAGFLIGLIFFGLLLTEDSYPSAGQSRGHVLELAFETVSAFGTVGLSMGTTQKLTSGGRLLIILMMFLGRLGPLTLAVALTHRKKLAKTRFRYAKAEIMVG